MPRLLISAAHKSSGKTTVSIGLCAALRARGLEVQAFKKGPDYIDPMWLTRASGRTCRNLDPYLMGWDEIRAMFQRRSAGADVILVEGNKGLYDGLALDGSNSNAALAQYLDLPVVLVLDARGMTRGVAPLILGYQAFDRGIRIAGVILNNLGGTRHEAKLRAVIEHYTDVAVLGAIQQDAQLQITERHLGLMPSNEAGDAAARIVAIGTAIGDGVDLDRLLDVARSAAPLAGDEPRPRVCRLAPRSRVRIGLARDRAFGFYYPDDLEALEAAGADLIPIDTLRDAHLPALDALFIGGGFPEAFMVELEANAGLRTEIRAAIDAGLPTYAECGGLMYLARTISWRGKTCRMVGAVPGDAVMHDRPVGRGYVEIAETSACPWPRPAHEAHATLRAHEFHYSSLENLGDGVRFALDVKRGHGIDGKHDGILYRNVLASYVHRRSVGADDWPARFVAFVRRIERPVRSAGALGLSAAIPERARAG
jgi:cobyrinic acid a,c-diamide synthase